MAYNNRMIQENVDFRDVQRALGTSKHYENELCTHQNINKWAWYKPIRNSKIGMIDEQDRINVNYGLVPTENVLAKNAINKGNTATEADFTNAVSDSKEWTYNRPRGKAVTGENAHGDEWFRITDFRDEADAMRGYKPTTDPPVFINPLWNMTLANLEEVLSYSLSSSYSQPQQWISVSGRKCGLIPEHLFKFRLGLETWENIGGADTMTIPLPRIFQVEGTWRMGLMVYVPSYTAGSNSFTPRVGLFVSLRPLQTYNQTGDVLNETTPYVLPDLATNQNLVLHMKNYLEANTGLSSYSFRCLPLLVKNAGISVDPNGSSVSMNTVYTMPCDVKGVMETSILVKKSLWPDNAIASAGNGWYLGNFFSGQYALVNGIQRPVRNFVIFYDQSWGAPTISRTFRVTVQYTYYNSTTVTDGTINSNYSYTAPATFESNGITYYGLKLTGGIDLATKSGTTPTISIVN